MKLPKKKYIFSKDELIAEVKKVKTLAMKKAKSWETRFDDYFENIKWTSKKGTISIKDFIKSEIQTARLDVIEEFKDLLDEFNEIDANAMQFELRITRPVEFAKRLEALKTPPEK